MAKKKYRKQPLLEHNRMRLSEISTYFRNLRLFSDLSQEDVAEQSKLPLGTIKWVESGYNGNPKNFSLKTLFDLADFFQMPIREVMDID